MCCIPDYFEFIWLIALIAFVTSAGVMLLSVIEASVKYSSPGVFGNDKEWARQHLPQITKVTAAIAVVFVLLSIVRYSRTPEQSMNTGDKSKTYCCDHRRHHHCSCGRNAPCNTK